MEVLAEMNLGGSVELLKKMAATDAGSRVRRAAIRSLGTLNDPDQAGFFRRRFADDDSFQVQAEALRAMGRTGDRRAAEWAMEEIANRGKQDEG